MGRTKSVTTDGDRWIVLIKNHSASHRPNTEPFVLSCLRCLQAWPLAQAKDAMAHFEGPNCRFIQAASN